MLITTKQCKGFLKNHVLLSLTLASVVLGLAAGFALRGVQLSNETLQLINFPGEIYMRVLKLMILPLIFSSLIASLAQMDAHESSQMGILTIGYYIVTMAIATAVGIILVLVIHPGDPSIKRDTFYVEDTEAYNSISPLDTFLDVVRNMFPRNLLTATFQRVQTKYYKIKPRRQQQRFEGPNSINGSQNQHAGILRKKIENVSGMNILGIIVFCIGFGIVISQFGPKAAILAQFFITLETVIMKLLGIFMWMTPLGIVSLIAGNLLELNDLNNTAAVLLLYVITIFCGIAIHTIIVMPLLYFCFTGENPFVVVRGMFPALVTAFGTASGGAALPVSMYCVEDKLKIEKRISRFVLPLGSTINLDGNALYEAVSIIFIAQLNNVELSLPEVITIRFHKDTTKNMINSFEK